MPLKIAHVVSYPYHGGTQEYVAGLAKAQKQSGHCVSIFASGNEMTNYHDLNVTAKKTLLTIFRNPVSLNLPLTVFKAETNYNVLHLHLPFPITADLVVFLTQLRKKLFAPALVATYHFDIDLSSGGLRKIAYLYNHTVLDAALSGVEKIIVSSKAFAEQSLFLRKYQEKVAVVPMGIDTSIYTPGFGCLPRIVFVGRIIPEKGIDYLVRAMEHLNETELVIAGKIVDYKYYSYLVRLSEELNLKNKIIFMGYVPQDKLVDLYRSAQAVVLPSTSRLESFGITLLEALSCGKPIVATNLNPGAVELIRQSKCGVIVPPCDTVALSNAIQTVQNDTEFGHRARKYVEDNHDWKIVANRVVKIYEEILSEKSRYA